ncbi:MAG: hypothetical protein AAGA55_10830, partial [Planctomycetota bacterium]
MRSRDTEDEPACFEAQTTLPEEIGGKARPELQGRAMTAARTVRHRVQGRSWAWLLAAAWCSLWMTGCSGPNSGKGGSPSTLAAASIDAPIRRLEALAELEAFRSTPNPPVTPASWRESAQQIDDSYPRIIATGTAAFAQASRSLDSVLEELTVAPRASAAPLPDTASRRSALRDYTAARSARLAGDSERAAILLERAIKLDPGSRSLWSELGQTYIDAGDRFGASHAFRTAAELGSREPGVFLFLADMAASMEDPDGVIRWSGEVFRDPAAEGTPQRAIAGVRLGTALLQREHLRAGAGVLHETLTWLARPRVTGEPLEITRIRARRGELAILAGDAWAALGQPDEAFEAYRLAGVDDPSIGSNRPT